MDLQVANLCQQTSQKSTSTNVYFLPNGIDAPQFAAATRIFLGDVGEGVVKKLGKTDDVIYGRTQTTYTQLRNS